MKSTEAGFFLVTDAIRVETRGESHMVDLTDDLRLLVQNHKLEEGHALYQALLLITYSHDIGDDDVLHESLTALRNVAG